MLSKLGPSKRVVGQSREIIGNVHAYFTEQKNKRLRKGEEEAVNFNVAKETSRATGVSVATIYKIQNQAADPEVLSSPGKTRPNAGARIVLDDFTVCAIRGIVHDMYINGDHVTLATINAKSRPN